MRVENNYKELITLKIRVVQYQSEGIRLLKFREVHIEPVKDEIMKAELLKVLLAELESEKFKLQTEINEIEDRNPFFRQINKGEKKDL